jgi:hypothetical protein
MSIKTPAVTETPAPKAIAFPKSQKELAVIITGVELTPELCPAIIAWAGQAANFLATGQQKMVNSAARELAAVLQKDADADVDADGIYMAEDTRRKVEKFVGAAVKMAKLSNELYADHQKKTAVETTKA